MTNAEELDEGLRRMQEKWAREAQKPIDDAIAAYKKLLVDRSDKVSASEDVDLVMPHEVMYPYTIIRGKSITPEQAKQLIINEVPLFKDVNIQMGEPQFRKNYLERSSRGILGLILYGPYNKWLDSWLCTDGTVGHNTTIKAEHIDAYNILPSWIKLGTTYDFLDMVVAITDIQWQPCFDCRLEQCNKFARYSEKDVCAEQEECAKIADVSLREADIPTDDYEKWFELTYKKKYQFIHHPKDTYKRAKVAIWLHEGRVDILTGEQAQAKCKEYEDKYTTEAVKRNLESSLFNRDVNCICSKQYIKDCFSALGVDSEEFYGYATWYKVIADIPETLHVVNGV